MSKLIAYMGWLGHKNIGDEACYEYIKSLLPPKHKIVYWDAHKWTHSELPALSILGGGTIFDIRHDRRGKGLFNFLSRGIPTVIWGSGVCPLSAPPKRPAISKMHPRSQVVLEKSAFVGVRGPISKNSLITSGFADVTTIGDPAFLLEPTVPFTGKGSNRIAVNIGDTHTNLFGTEEKVLSETIKLVKRLTASNYEVILFSMWPQDNSFLRRIPLEKGVTLRPFDQSTLNLMNFFRTCHCVIGLKLHATVLAAASGVPFIAMGYREKNFDFAASIKLEGNVIRTDDAELCNNIMNTLSEVNMYYDKNIDIINKYKLVYKKRHLSLADTVRGLL